MYKLKTSPWKHQLRALDYAMVRDRAAIFTDMGSGKTKIMIDLIVNKGFNTVLIVGTKKSCDVWEQEFQTHSDLPKNCVFNLCGMPTTDKLTLMRAKLLRNEDRLPLRVFIMNYEAVWRDPLKQFLYNRKYDCIICDESHRLKTPNSKVSVCMTTLGRRAKCRYILSGTPTPESPMDIYGQYRFLDPTIFGNNFSKFKQPYENIDVQETVRRGYVVLDEKQPYTNLDILKKRIYSCAFYAESDVELPKVTHIYFNQYLSQEAQEVYKELNREGVYEDKLGITETNNILAKYTRLQQLLSGYLPAEDEDFTQQFTVEKDHTKAEALEYILGEIPKHEKVVIFAKYRKDFDNIMVICRQLHRRYGEISGQQDDYAKWKKGRVNVVAVQYNSGAESISLVEARYCIYYSHTFSYGQYQQSIKRTHRPGQKRPVTYYHIISKVKGKQTVDDKIKKALSMKQSLSDYILTNELKQSYNE